MDQNWKFNTSYVIFNVQSIDCILSILSYSTSPLIFDYVNVAFIELQNFWAHTEFHRNFYENRNRKHKNLVRTNQSLVLLSKKSREKERMEGEQFENVNQEMMFRKTNAPFTSNFCLLYFAITFNSQSHWSPQTTAGQMQFYSGCQKHLRKNSLEKRENQPQDRMHVVCNNKCKTNYKVHYLRFEDIWVIRSLNVVTFQSSPGSDVQPSIYRIHHLQNRIRCKYRRDIAPHWKNEKYPYCQFGWGFIMIRTAVLWKIWNMEKRYFDNLGG